MPIGVVKVLSVDFMEGGKPEKTLEAREMNHCT